MLDAVALAVDLALFIVTVVVVGQKPTVAKVVAMICLVAVVDYGYLALVAMQAQENPIEWYQQLLGETMKAYNGAFSNQSADYDSVIAVVAGISPALYVVQSSVYVFIGLCIRWVIDRVRSKSEWSPFSQVDLSVWWLMPLLFGICCYTASLFLQNDAARIVWLVAMNVLVVSVVVLFAQGAAAGKGIMNRMGLSMTWQIVLGVFGIISWMLFLVVPFMGLVDFWANFRKIARDDSKSSSAGAN